MERNEISPHEVKVYLALKSSEGKWLTNAELGEKLSDVSARTVRAHTLRLVKLGVIEHAEVFPSHRYRLHQKRNANYVARLTQAAEVMGLS